MPNFSIKYSYARFDVIHYGTAVVRASSVEAAHNKLVRFFTQSGKYSFDDFKIIKTSLSSYSLILS